MSRPQPLQSGDPQQIGGFWLTERLGAGGQGTVYLGLGPDGARVAVKLLHRRPDGDEWARQFVREVETPGRVFQYTARVLEAGIHKSAPYIVSEYISGESLEDYVALFGPYEQGALRRLASGTVTALATIHAAGIVHCDFKPGNILLGPDGPRVIDFGISRALSTVPSGENGHPGTPAYMAPEQISNGGTVGPHTDVFAWASTMVYAATGEPAFGHGDIPQGVMHRIVHEAPDLSGVPGPLRELLAACLVKQPDRRPTAADVLLSLLELEPSPGLMPFGAQVGDPLTGHTDTVTCLAYAKVDGRPVAVTGSHDRTVRVWDLAAGRQLGEPLTGHTGAVLSVVTGELDGRPIAVTGSHDTTLRVWDLAAGRQLGEPLAGHSGAVESVAFGDLDGRPIAVSVSQDRSVRVWSLDTGRPTGPPLTGNNAVMSVAFGRSADGRPLAIVGGSYDQSVRVWDLGDRTQMGGALTGHTSTVTSVVYGVLNRQPVAITGGYDMTVRVWDLATGRQLGAPLDHGSAVQWVAYGRLGARSIALTSAADMTVRVWDLGVGQQIGPALTVGRRAGVTAPVTYGQLDGRPVVITCGGDLAVRVWSLGAPYTM